MILKLLYMVQYFGFLCKVSFYCHFLSCITGKENLNRSDESQKEVQTEVN